MNKVVEALNRYAEGYIGNTNDQAIFNNIPNVAEEALPIAEAQAKFIEAFDEYITLDDDESYGEYAAMIEARQELQQLQEKE